MVTLYRILKRTKGFKDDKKWRSMPSLEELADYLNDEVERLHPYREVRYDCKDGKLMFCVYYAPGELDRTHCLPLQWLPFLQAKISYSLYRLLLRTLAMVAHKWNLDVIINQYNDMVISSPEEYMGGDDEEDYLLKKHVLDYQEGGEADRFRKELQQLPRGENLTDLKREIQEYRTGSPMGRLIKKWLKLGIVALERAYDIEELFFHEPFEGYEDTEAINASDMYSFVWSFHDKVHGHNEDWYESLAHNGAPAVGPMIRTTYFPNRAPVVSADVEHIKALARFLEFGRQIYFKYYDKSLRIIYQAEAGERDRAIAMLIEKQGPRRRGKRLMDILT